MITLLIMTNGRREYLERSLATVSNLKGNFTRTVIHDDSGSKEFQDWLKSRYPYEVIESSESNGFGKAIISAWKECRKDKNEWIFHLEEDFLITEPVEVTEMIKVLKKNPHLIQMALLRQPLGGREKRKGGIVNSHPERYFDKSDGIHNWMEHRVYFTTNPSVYAKTLIDRYPWPDTTYSERVISRQIFADPNNFCAYWGKRSDPPKVRHIGEVRTGSGY